MTRTQRLLSLVVAAAIAVGALVFLSGGEDPTDTARTPTASETVTRPPAEAAPTPAATPIQAEAEPRASEAVARPPGETGATPTPTPTATPRPQPPLLTAAEPRTLRFEEGETIVFRVRSDTPEEVHVHGYDRYVDIPAGRTRTVRFDASLTGIFEVELHGSGAEIGRLRVEPQ